ncbi:non-ribosomal peptide synthetase [Methylocapsa acidiphila]|uniref:non-ribosomal peptide synthetase n=1 Tax=Methylocapsa acidiphila TaxID=133552 RepID=UPI0003F78D79|nr:non-ribosomal peptide synthetase [Methylocapsa acidiphila]
MTAAMDRMGFSISRQQEKLWRSRAALNGALAPIRARVLIDGPFDADRMGRAIAGLASRHEILRTGFETLPDMALPVQVIGDEDPAAMSWPGWSKNAAFAAEIISLAPESHVLELRLSPLCADAVSVATLFRELAALYRDGPDTLADEPLQYADYAAWQRELLAADEGEGRRYWFGQDAANAPALRLPLEAESEERLEPNPGRRACLTIPLPPETAAALRAFSACGATSAESALLAAWSILLRRHLGAEVFTLGFLCDARTAEIASAVGPYAHFLPFPIALGAGQTFGELAARLEADLALHREWREYAPDTARGLDFGFGCREAPPASLRAGSIALSLEAEDAPAEPCRLHLQSLIGTSEVSLALHYDSSRLGAEAAACMIKQLLALLADALPAPDKAWERLSLVGPSERLWLAARNGGPPRQPPVAGLHQLLDEPTRRAPEAVALCHAGAEITYYALDRRATALAGALIEAGLAAEDRVGLLMRNPLRMVEAVFAVLKAGGAYVPLDPAHPAERTTAILADADARFLVTEAKLADARAGFNGIVLLHEDQDASPRDASASRPSLPAIDPDQLAYLIYTSGSTGRPKGVAVSHAAALRSTLARHALYPEQVAGFLLLSSFSFDSSVAGLFWTLSQGGRLCLPQEEERRNPAALATLIERHSLSHVLCLPSLWAVLLEQDPGKLRSLRAAIVAGEACSPRLGALHARLAPGAKLYNEYGPTEGAVWSTVHEVGAEPDAIRVPIGRPIEGVRIHILDAAGVEAPRGIAGEIHIGGGGVARGYFRQPSLTAASFTPDPFGGAGARLYRSGDVGRWRLDGAIDFLGRSDDQIKIRGHRIELGEIEARLRLLPAVRDCAVLALEDEAGEKRLAAYLDLTASDDQEASDARERRIAGTADALKSALPDYMIPADWIVLAELPRNANGKVDRARLPAPDRAGTRRAYVAPRGPIETALAEIWQELLSVAPIGVDDNFFELGGDSILSIQMVGRARRRGVIVTARQMIEHQTIARLAAVAARAPDVGAPEISPSNDRPRDVPLTPIQRWFFELNYEKPELWTHALLLDLRKPLPAGTLEAAAALLLRRHESLRSRFDRAAGAWRQTILPDAGESGMTRIALPALAETERRAEIERLSAEFMPLDLGGGSMLRLVHFEGEAGTPGQILVVLHHLVADGLSWRLIVEDLDQACRDILAGSPTPDPAPGARFSDWSNLLQGEAQKQGLAEEAQWCGEQIRRAPSLRPDDPQGDRREASSASLVLSFDADETETLLRRAAPSRRASVEDFLLTALALSLARREGAEGDGEKAVLIDLDRHGRESGDAELDLSRAVGWFTSVAPHLLTVDPAALPVANLARVKEQIRRVPRRGLGYGIARYLAPEAIRAALPGKSDGIIFNYMGQLDPSFGSDSLFALADGIIRSGSNPEWERPYELAVNADVVSGRLRVAWDYGAKRWRHETIEALAKDFQDSLRSLVSACVASGAGGYAPSDFPLARLDQNQLKLLLGESKEIADVYPLTPLQEGMLFHSLYAPRSGVYVEHLSCVLKGSLDPPAFEAAWGQVMREFAILRTGFAWDGLDAPLQLVHEAVAPPLVAHDWRSSPHEEQERLWAELLEEDWRQGFDFATAPLMRLALARTGDNSWNFLWSHHHILLDGWSAPLVLRRAFDCYRARVSGERPSQAPRALFRDYIAHLRGRDPTASERFFRSYLAGFKGSAPPRDEAATAPGAATESKEFAHFEKILTLDEAATAALEAAARDLKVTLNTILQGALAVLLARLSRRREALFGISVSGRPAELPGIEEMVGLFINALPLRVALPPEASIGDWLRGLLALNAELRQHESTPLVDIQGWSETARGQPLFDVLFAFENYPVDKALSEQQGPLVAEQIRFREQTHYPLTVVAFPGRELVVKFNAAPCAFTPGFIDFLVSGFGSVLAGIARSPEGVVGNLSLLTPAEEHRLISAQRGEGVSFAHAGSLAALFEAQAALRPEAVAVSFGDASLSYGGLNASANRLARHLRRLGVGPEVRVGLRLERSPAMIVAILAVIKAGGAYVPLDPAHPQERLAWLAEDASLALLLTEEALRANCPEHWPEAARVPLLRLDRDAALWADEPEDNLADASLQDQLAYVIYTSGSTGKPKGVLVSQRNLVRLFAATQEFGFGPDDVWTLFHSTAFDFSVWEMWGALLHGGRLVVTPYWASRDPEAFYDLLRREKVTVLNQTPSAFRQLLASEAFAAGRRDLALRLVIFGGEALDPACLLPWLARYGDARPRLVNMYGITETTVHVTQADQDLALAQQRRTQQHAAQQHTTQDQAGGLIGRPLPDLSAYLLDDALRPVPQGVEGELYIGGAGLARGYHNRPDLTAERFIPDPFGGAGARLYKTGDRARLREDGRLDYLGRIDLQVKIRGHRVELGEIEAAIRLSPNVEDAVVVQRGDETTDGGGTLVAFVVPKAAQELDDSLGAEEQITQWRSVFDAAYSPSAPKGDPRFDISGWVSSYTGQPAPAAEMREWVERSVERVRALGPRRAFEIGCGTGLLLLRLAPHCEHYVGADFSAAALRSLQSAMGDDKSFAHVRLLERFADDFSGLEAGDFDTVVLNSIVQYFPSLDYLTRVLKGAAALLAPNGRIFIGDIRSFALLPAFHLAVELEKAPGSLPSAELRRLLPLRLQQEEELALDPGFFTALRDQLPGIGRVDLLLKRGVHANEMAQFRYDAILRREEETEPFRADADLDWTKEVKDLAGLRRILEADQDLASLRIMGVPNRRIAGPVHAARLLARDECPATVEGLRQAAAAAQSAAIDPEAIWALGEELGYEVAIHPGVETAEGVFDVTCRRRAGGRDGQLTSPTIPARAFGPAMRRYANDPAQGRRMRRLGPRLREFLGRSLPDYMIPGFFMALPALPLTANGKVDRAALPALELRDDAAQGYVAPETPTQKILIEIWTEVLGVARIGIHDNFFELGGHSLLATQILSRLRKTFRVDLPLRSLFEAPTPSQFAEILEAKLIEALDQLSEEEAESLLRQMAPAEATGLPRAANG